MRLPPQITARKAKSASESDQRVAAAMLRLRSENDAFSQRVRDRGILDPVHLNKVLSKVAAGDLSATT